MVVGRFDNAQSQIGLVGGAATSRTPITCTGNHIHQMLKLIIWIERGFHIGIVEGTKFSDNILNVNINFLRTTMEMKE